MAARMAKARGREAEAQQPEGRKKPEAETGGESEGKETKKSFRVSTRPGTYG